MNKALNLSVYCVSGEDATNLLQGQLTQDMTVTDKTWRYAAHCNPKGRVISIYHTFNVSGVHYLITPLELADEAIAQIQKYVMRSKVVIEKSSFNVYFCDNKGGTDRSFHQDNNGDITLSLTTSTSLLLSEVKQELNHQALWDNVRIQLGVPRIYTETLGVFTPEAINLDLSNAVSFTKGCYTGQEIVARMHYLGKAKQRLYPLAIGSDITIKPNSVITNTRNEKVGLIADIDNNGNALGSLRVDKLDSPLSVDGALITVINSYSE